VYFSRRFATKLDGSKYEPADLSALPIAMVTGFVGIAHRSLDRVRQLHRMCPPLVFAKSNLDEMAVEASAHVGLVDSARYLAEAGAPVSICTAAMLGERDLVKEMLAEDAHRVRERGAHDFPVLSFTAFGEEQAEIASLLIAAGASARSHRLGQSPLHVAAGAGYLELAKILLDHGADVNLASRARMAPGTPLAIAIRAKKEKMADLLRSRGGRMS